MYKSLIAAWNVGITTCACNERRHELRERNERGLWNSLIFIFQKSLHTTSFACRSRCSSSSSDWTNSSHVSSLSSSSSSSPLSLSPPPSVKEQKKKNKNYKILTHWVPNDETTKHSSYFSRNLENTLEDLSNN